MHDLWLNKESNERVRVGNEALNEYTNEICIVYRNLVQEKLLIMEKEKFLSLHEEVHEIETLVKIVDNPSNYDIIKMNDKINEVIQKLNKLTSRSLTKLNSGVDW
jgi:hypothetical protein